jgi:hypothetical protein
MHIYCRLHAIYAFLLFSRVYHPARLHALYAFLLFRVYTLHPGYTRYMLFFFFTCIPSCTVTRDICFSSFSRVYSSPRLHAISAFLLFRVYTLHPGYTRYSQYTQYICNTRNTPDTRNTRNICSSTSHKSCR